ncbi:2-oxoglutarate dehydrogenase, E2 component, dihydrolipoamide succinyltransferase, partial [Streptomyces lavendulocolor]
APAPPGPGPAAPGPSEAAAGAPAVLTAGPGWAGPRPAGVLRPLSLREALSALAGVCGLSPGPAPA